MSGGVRGLCLIIGCLVLLCLIFGVVRRVRLDLWLMSSCLGRVRMGILRLWLRSCWYDCVIIDVGLVVAEVSAEEVVVGCSVVVGRGLLMFRRSVRLIGRAGVLCDGVCWLFCMCVRSVGSVMCGGAIALDSVVAHVDSYVTSVFHVVCSAMMCDDGIESHADMCYA